MILDIKVQTDTLTITKRDLTSHVFKFVFVYD